MIIRRAAVKTFAAVIILQVNTENVCRIIAVSKSVWAVIPTFFTHVRSADVAALHTTAQQRGFKSFVEIESDLCAGKFTVPNKTFFIGKELKTSEFKLEIIVIGLSPDAFQFGIIGAVVAHIAFGIQTRSCRPVTVSVAVIIGRKIVARRYPAIIINVSYRLKTENITVACQFISAAGRFIVMVGVFNLACPLNFVAVVSQVVNADAECFKFALKFVNEVAQFIEFVKSD